jgi:hypothetical protein
MIQNSKKAIQAVVEIEAIYKHDKIKPPWTISKSDNYISHVRLYAGIGDEEIGSVMYVACNYNSYESADEIIKETAVETLRAFVSEESIVLPGGLEFKENDEVKVTPGCCCGLEDWIDWLEIKKGENNIWNGHDPFALVENDGQIIKIWEDKENKNESPSIEFTVEELTNNMKIIERDLKDFLIRLAQWTKNIEPELEKQVVNYFARNMHIDV